MNRDEYIERMKQHIDEWNTKIRQWEGEMHKAQANVKTQYETQLKKFEQQRDEMMHRMKEVQSASQSAWGEMSKGFEEAWKAMSSSFEKAWSEFHKKKNTSE